MSYEYLFNPLAATEYEDAYKWYHEKSEVAADELILEVEETIRAICKYPHRYRKSYKNLHEVSLKKYPYYLIYFIDDDKKSIIIISLYHHKTKSAEQVQKVDEPTRKRI